MFLFISNILLIVWNFAINFHVTETIFKSNDSFMRFKYKQNIYENEKVVFVIFCFVYIEIVFIFENVNNFSIKLKSLMSP